jgi:DNA-binding NarL/FixJ family response regulator
MRVGGDPKWLQDRGMRPIALLLVDDHLAFLETVALRLRAHADLRVVAAVSEPSWVLQQDVARDTDVALLDLQLSHLNGIEVGRALRALNPRLALVALTASESDGQATAAVAAGFTGWVAKDATLDELIETIHAVHAGETRIPTHLLVDAVRHLLARRELVDEAGRRLMALSARERQVLNLMVEGCARHAIAGRLYISPNTVRTHQQHILAKLGVHSALAAVALVTEVTRTAEHRRTIQRSVVGDGVPRPRWAEDHRVPADARMRGLS